MICPNCGREIPDGTICPCTLEAPPPLSDNPAVNAMKTVGSSGLFLALAILFSASALLAVFSSAGINDSLSNILYYAYSMGVDMNSINYMMDMMHSTTIVNAVISSIPAILTAVAAWIHYGTCRNIQSGNISTAGLTIYKVLAYINLIGLCLATFFVVAIAVIVIIMVAGSSFPVDSLFGASAYAASGQEVRLSLILIFGIFAAFFAFFMALAIAYQASIIRTINRAKIIAATGLADARVSGYLIGMNYVLAVISVIFALTSLALAPLSAIASLVAAADRILAAVLLSRYRKAMELVIFPPVAPPVPPQIYGIPQPDAPMPPAGDVQEALDQDSDSEENQPPQ